MSETDLDIESGGTSPMISLEHVVKTFTPGKGTGKADSRPAVEDVSFDVEPGKFFTLLGPSGCGKTTTLRMLAGLAEPDSGRINVSGRTMFDREHNIDVPAHRRGLGMVFQSYAIWPHMTVYKNVAFPLSGRFRRDGQIKKQDLAFRVKAALRLVQLDEYEDRPATDLSGGQQQRLALARALVIEPQVLLLDEPLSNLDAKLRESMQFELKKIQRELGITTVYVTHDQTEALALSNSIAVMNRGRIEQIGHPRDIYQNPQSRFVADFIGTSNFVPGLLKQSTSPDEWRVVTALGDLTVPTAASLPTGTEVTVSIRPEHVKMTAPGDGPVGPNVVRGRVLARAFRGDSVQHQVTVGDVVLRVQCNPALAFNTGADVELALPPEWCSIIPGGTL
jgi:iron(III) transport system ATP-binding protein